jgi:hypothetical protein
VSRRAALAAPASAATTQTVTTSCEVKWDYGGSFPAIYKAAAKITVTKDAGRIIAISSPSITRDGMVQGAGISEYVTAVTWRSGNTLLFSAAGLASKPAGKWVSCSASKSF